MLFHVFMNLKPMIFNINAGIIYYFLVLKILFVLVLFHPYIFLTMFWRFNFQGSTLDQLLNKPETTLQDILSQPEVIQELKTQNSKLITFIAQPDKIQCMLQFIATFNIDYAPVSSEIFALELPQIATVLFAAPHLIESFIRDMLLLQWSSYEGLSFIKVISSILYRDPKSSLQILKTIKINDLSFLQTIFNKISNDGHTILYELLLKLSALDEVLQEDFIVDWFKNEHLVDFLVQQLNFSTLNTPNAIESISSASSCLLDLFAVAQAISVVQVPLSNNHIIIDLLDSNWILSTLSIVNTHFKQIQSNTTPNIPAPLLIQSYTSFMSLLNDLIRRNYLDFVLSLHQQALTIRMEEFTEHDVMLNILNKPRSYLLDVHLIGLELSEYLDLFYVILSTGVTPTNAADTTSTTLIQSSVGPIKPYSMLRLQQCELIIELLRMVLDQDQCLISTKLRELDPNNDQFTRISPPNTPTVIINRIIKSNLLVLIISQFFEYPWCNILHSLVLDVITFVFDSVETEEGTSTHAMLLAMHVLEQSNLVSGLIECTLINNKNILEPRTNRLPYMGHVTLIGEILIKHLQTNKSKYSHIQVLQSELWMHFSLVTIPQTIKKDRQILGGIKPPLNTQIGGEAAIMSKNTSSIISSDSGYMLDPFQHKQRNDDILHKSSGKLTSMEELDSKESDTVEVEVIENSDDSDKPAEPTKETPKETPNTQFQFTSIEDPFEQTITGQWIGVEAAKGLTREIGQMMPLQFINASIAAIDGSGMTFAKDHPNTTTNDILIQDPFDIKETTETPVKVELTDHDALLKEREMDRKDRQEKREQREREKKAIEEKRLAEEMKLLEEKLAEEKRLEDIRLEEVARLEQVRLAEEQVLADKQVEDDRLAEIAKAIANQAIADENEKPVEPLKPVEVDALVEEPKTDTVKKDSIKPVAEEPKKVEPSKKEKKEKEKTDSVKKEDKKTVKEDKKSKEEKKSEIVKDTAKPVDVEVKKGVVEVKPVDQPSLTPPVRKTDMIKKGEEKKKMEEMEKELEKMEEVEGELSDKDKSATLKSKKSKEVEPKDDGGFMLSMDRNATLKSNKKKSIEQTVPNTEEQK